MQGRTLSRLLAASAAAVLLPRLAISRERAAARNGVVAHRLYADASCWTEVIGRLQRSTARSIRTWSGSWASEWVPG